MASNSAGYDTSSSVYSPDGTVHQVEYAGKAAAQSPVAIALRVSDGVVFAVQKIIQSKLVVPGANRRIQSPDEHIGLACAGLTQDAFRLAEYARDEANSYRDRYRSPITVKALADHTGYVLQTYTLYGSVRPFGVHVLLGGVDEFGPQLYFIDQAGKYGGYRGCAIGKNNQLARTEIEKLELETLSAKEALVEAARIIHHIHDATTNKEFEIEMSWASTTDTNGKHLPVPKDVAKEAEDKAKAALNEDDDDDDEDEEMAS